MKDLSLAEMRSLVDVRGEFGAACRLKLSEESLEAVSAGHLKIRIGTLVHRNVSSFDIEIGAAGGEVSINLGREGSMVKIGAGVRGAYNIILWRASELVIGDKTTANGVRIFGDDSEITLGEDCMLSDLIQIQAADQHGIVDLASKRIINNYRRKVRIAPHVWLGRGVTVMPDLQIGQGAVIGAGAVVVHDVPEFCVAAGVPAKVVREGTSWCRNPESIDDGARRVMARWAGDGLGHV